MHTSANRNAAFCTIASNGARAGVLFLMVVVSAVALPVAAQSFLVRTYSVDDGLPSLKAVGLAQDQLGRVWVATDSGILAYDGLEWQKIADPPGGLPLDLSLHGTDHGEVVAIVARTPPVVAVWRNGSWSTLDLEGRDWPAGAVLSCSAVSADGDGRIMVALGTEAHGMVLFNRGGWRRCEATDAAGMSSISALAAVSGGFLVAGAGALSRIELGDGEPILRELASSPATRWRAVALGSGTDPAGPTLWAASHTGLFRLMGGDLVPVATWNADTFVEAWGPIQVVEALGAVVVGNSFRLLRVDPRKGELHELGFESGLRGTGARQMLRDREGNLWIANVRGVSKLISLRFANYRASDGLLESEVSAACERAPGQLLFGHSGGLTLYDGVFRTVSLRADTDPTVDARAMGMAVDHRGAVWIAASTRGLCRLQPDDQLQCFAADDGLELPVHAVAVAQDGGLWVGGARLQRSADGRFVPYHPQELQNIRRLLLRSNGELVVATAERGVFIVDSDGPRSIPRPGGSGFTSSFTAFEDHNGRLWVGTAGGLLVLTDGRLVEPAPPELRFGRAVYMIVEDGDERLWFGTATGVVRWNGLETTNISEKHGLADPETNRAAALLDSNGRLWLGTANGLSRYDSSFDLTRDQPPLLELVAIETEHGTNSPVDADLELSAPHSSLIFMFRAMSFLDEDDVRYRYRLEGFDSEWITTPSARNRSARYTAVPPGSYRFLVQARSAEGTWSQTVRSGAIRVLPPLWHRWWFLLLAATLVAGVSSLAIMTRLGRRESQRLRRAVQQQEKDAADLRQAKAAAEEANRAKSQFLARMSHEMRTPLNITLGVADLLQQTELDREQRDLLSTATTSAENLLRLINDLLDLAQVEVGRLRLQLQLFDIRGELSELCWNFRVEAEASGHQLRYSVDREVPETLRGDAFRLRQVLTNLIGNALKYSDGGPVEVRCGVHERDGNRVRLAFAVEDHGDGIAPDRLARIFEPFEQGGELLTRNQKGSGLGLAVSHQLVQLLGGEISVDSAVGEGSTFSFTCVFEDCP